MNTREKTTLHEVKFGGTMQNVYVAAESEHEVTQIIGERYDSDRFSFDWSDFEIIDQVERVPENVIKGSGEPHRVIWKTDSGTRGLEKRVNQAGSKGLYYI